MIFPEEHSPDLKAWITERLANNISAEPDVLADYVTTLMLQEGDVAAVRENCHKSIVDFVDEDPVRFLDDVFQAIHTQSYLKTTSPHSLPANQTAPIPTTSSFPRPNQGATHSVANSPSPQQQQQQQSVALPPVALPQDVPNALGGIKNKDNHGRKRAFQEQGEADAVPGAPGQGAGASNRNDNKKAIKKRKRTENAQGKGPQSKPNPMNALDQPHQVGLWHPAQGQNRERNQGWNPNRNTDRDPGWGHNKRDYHGGGFDSAPPGAFGVPEHIGSLMQRQIRQLQAAIGMGMPAPPQQVQTSASTLANGRVAFDGLGGNGGSGGSGWGTHPQKIRCRDYDTIGYCQRGTACPYDHGYSASMYSDAFQPPQEYTPVNPYLALPSYPPTTVGNGLNWNQAGTGVQGPYSGSGLGSSPAGNRAPFAADGQGSDRAKTTLVIEGIPEPYLSEEHVRMFFGQFGEIVQVTMEPHKRQALVRYRDWKSAKTAFWSPRPIFDNRFVKVSWQRGPDEALPPPASQNSGSGSAHQGKPQARTQARGLALPALKQESVSDKSEAAGRAPSVGMGDFARKQEQAQKMHEERVHKQKELERSREEVQKRQQELEARRSEAEKLLRAVTAATAPEADQEGVAGAAKVPVAGEEKTTNGSDSTTELLKAKLASLEEEAKSLGLDPNAPDHTPASWTSIGPQQQEGNSHGGSGSLRGSVRAGRGGFRGSFRGGFHGSENVHAAYAAFSLDNRPKTVAVSGVNLGDPEKYEILRHFLLGIGEFKDIKASETSTEILFHDRKIAEKFMATGRRIPGIDAVLELAWATAGTADGKTETVGAAPSASASVPPAAGNKVANHGNGGDANGNKAKPPQGKKTTKGGGEGDEATEEGEIVDATAVVSDGGAMDYDVADEDYWGDR